MKTTETIAGVILAGGLARRMDNQDKGLVLFKGQPLVSHAISALRPVVDELMINANRNHDDYRRFGFPVVADQTDDFSGPLAGMLAALCNTQADVLVIVPCDSPLITAGHLQKLVVCRREQNADVAVAFDGERVHPVFLAIKTGLKTSLQAYLESGGRKVEAWLGQQRVVRVDFSAQPELFANINTLMELSRLETGH
jgi:molybdopterin-guanine dinucleotide biosynthesis protein A